MGELHPCSSSSFFPLLKWKVDVGSFYFSLLVFLGFLWHREACLQQGGRQFVRHEDSVKKEAEAKGRGIR